MNLENYLILTFFGLVFCGMFLILTYDIIYHAIFLIKNIYKMERKKFMNKLIEIALGAITFGIVSICFFLSIIGWISFFALIFYFSIGVIFGALISLEEPRPSLKDFLIFSS